jgi:hypothetical protein
MKFLPSNTAELYRLLHSKGEEEENALNILKQVQEPM